MTRVMLVDDREDNLYYLTALLSAHGYEVDTARHGAEALVKSRAHPPTVIVSDLLMPTMDGYTLLRHWKADHRLKARAEVDAVRGHQPSPAARPRRARRDRARAARR